MTFCSKVYLSLHSQEVWFFCFFLFTVILKLSCFVGGPVRDAQSSSGGQRELVRVWSSLVWDPCIDVEAGVTSPLYRLTIYNAV